MLDKEDYLYTLSIPQHKEVRIGLLRKIVKQAGITPEEFNSLQDCSKPKSVAEYISES